MATLDTEERRKFPRVALNYLSIAAIWPDGPDKDRIARSGKNHRIHYVDVYNRSPEGIAFTSPFQFETEIRLDLSIYNSADKQWESFIGIPRWCAPDPSRNEKYLIGVEITPISKRKRFLLQAAKEITGPMPADYEFFCTVPFLQAIHRDAVCPLLNHITYRSVKAGQRFITQGHTGDTCYIVQSGSCRVIVQKNGRMHRVGRIGKRDFVGEIALLTDEPRSAHVIAEKDTGLWEIRKKLLDELIEANPEVGTFLTELVSERLSSRKLTADRSVGKYIIQDIVGRGGYAIVYKGYHSDLNRPVAVKMLKHDMALHPDFSRNFRKEAQTIANFNHENIVKVYDIEERYRTIFIIMEFLEGRTLKELLQEEGRLLLNPALEMILCACNGLYYAHTKGIIHQDIKPANIFTTAENQIKILDFGLSAPCGSEHFLAGTPFYMSPEQVECLPIDERTDIYSLGLTAYEMITGHKPFHGKDAFAIMNMHVECDIPDPADLAPDVPAVFRDFILKACARNPEKRYRTIQEVLKILRPLADQRGISMDGCLQNKRMMSTLIVSYHENQALEMNRLLEEFSDTLKGRGVEVRAVEFKDI